MRPAHPAPRHHLFRESHAKGVPNREAGDTAPGYAPRAQAETPNPTPRSDLATPATSQQAEQQTHVPAEMTVQYPGLIHAPAEKAGRQPESSPWLARYHPLGEGYWQACTVLRSVQGREHGIQPLPESQGQQQKPGPSPMREMDERQWNQPWMQQTNSIDFDSRPMRTTHPAARHHPFGGGYAINASNRQGGDTSPKYAPRAQADTGKKPLAPGIPRGPRTAEGCGKMAEFLAQAS